RFGAICTSPANVHLRLFAGLTSSPTRSRVAARSIRVLLCMRTSGFGDVFADSTPLPEAEVNFRGFRFLQEDGLSLRLLFEIQLSLEQKSLITLQFLQEL